MNFDVKTEKLDDGQYVISLSGEVDLYTAPEFKQQLLDAIDAGARDVIVDLTDTTFIDSTTLGVLVGGVKRLRTNEGQLSLVCSDRNITKIFEITGLDRVFTIYPTREAAVETGPSRSVSQRGLVGACAVLAVALAATGCGSTGLPEAGAGDATQGRELFIEKCGSCHVLADAGTEGRIGPNLDDAFRQSRADGIGETTIESVVRSQIAYPVEEPVTGSPGMPADIVTGEDADSVAAYVASVAALPVRPQPPTETGGGSETGGETGGEGESGEAADGEAIFAEAGCGSCHVLSAAGASGTIGPNLDESKPPKELVIDRVTNGQGAMPAFGEQYSTEQIAAVADYVVASTK